MKFSATMGLMGILVSVSAFAADIPETAGTIRFQKNFSVRVDDTEDHSGKRYAVYEPNFAGNPHCKLTLRSSEKTLFKKKDSLKGRMEAIDRSVRRVGDSSGASEIVFTAIRFWTEDRKVVAAVDCINTLSGVPETVPSLGELKKELSKYFSIEAQKAPVSAPAGGEDAPAAAGE